MITLQGTTQPNLETDQVPQVVLEQPLPAQIQFENLLSRLQLMFPDSDIQRRHDIDLVKAYASTILVQSDTSNFKLSNEEYRFLQELRNNEVTPEHIRKHDSLVASSISNYRDLEILSLQFQLKKHVDAMKVHQYELYRSTFETFKSAVTERREGTVSISISVLAILASYPEMLSELEDHLYPYQHVTAEQ